MSSFGITSAVVMAFRYWFEWQMEGGQVPLFEMVGAFALSVGAAVSMEFLARWAHRALWHASLWHPHEGLAMTYVFVHRGFCMGPIANVVRRIAVAHQMATGEGKYRRVKSLVLLALLGGLNVVASASSTLSFTNTCSIPIFPSLIPKDGSPKISNSTSLHAIGPNEELSVPLPDGWSGIAIFSTGCILNGLGARNCTTGNCKGRECTVEDSPVATGLDISSDIYTMSTDMGYNVGLTVSPMCAGCDCPSASCKALLESCPPDLRVFNEGTVVACRPGSGLQFSENQCTVPGDYGTSDVSITCPLKNIVMKIEVSC